MAKVVSVFFAVKSGRESKKVVQHGRVRERVTLRGTVAFDSTTTGETIPSIVWISCLQARRHRVASPHGCGASRASAIGANDHYYSRQNCVFWVAFAEVVVIPPEYSTPKYAENTPKRPSSPP